VHTRGYEGEALAIRARGCRLIEVRRPGAGSPGYHSSEAIPVVPDAVIGNGSTLADLCRAVDRLAA
jgi:hypothetical protein